MSLICQGERAKVAVIAVPDVLVNMLRAAAAAAALSPVCDVNVAGRPGRGGGAGSGRHVCGVRGQIRGGSAGD